MRDCLVKRSGFRLGFLLVPAGFLPVLRDTPIARKTRVCPARDSEFRGQAGDAYQLVKLMRPTIGQ